MKRVKKALDFRGYWRPGWRREFKRHLEPWSACFLMDPGLLNTRVTAFREILQSLQCKIVQYTFLGQYVIKLWDFFSQCKIPHPAWLQLDHNKLGLSGMRLFRPQYHKIEKTLFQMCCTALKNINQGIYWVLNVSG